MNSRVSSLENGFQILWYEIQSVLGRGGFGITYLARDTNLNQMVALKEYLPQDFASRSGNSTILPDSVEHDKVYAWGLERFMSEAQTLAKFKHDNIVRVLSVFKLNNTGYMVMEYETGRDLKSLYQQNQHMSQAELERIYYPVIDGLSEVHRAGFIHRDIKPSNIYIRSDGSPVLLDFGSARQSAGTATRTLTATLSVGYAPIEQYNNPSGKQGPWSDIYSMGASMYQGITGHRPIESTMRGMALIDREPDPYTPLSHSRIDGFSPHFLRAIDQSLMLQIQARPQTLGEFHDLLTGAVCLPEISCEDTRTVIRPRHFDSTTKKIVDTDRVTGQASAQEKYLRQDQSKPIQSTTSDKAESTGKQALSKPIRAGKLAGITLVAVLLFAAGMTLFLFLKQPAPEQLTQQKLKSLLQQAEQHFLAGNYFDLKNESALSLFDEVLLLDPGNTDAQVGQNKTGQHYLKVADKAIENQNFEQADTSLKIVYAIDPNFDGLISLQTRLDNKLKQVMRSSQIQQQLASANAAFARNDIYSPIDNNAYYFFKKVLLLDAKNVDAIQGLQKSAKRLLADLKAAVRSQDPDTASLVQRAEEMDPEMQGLDAIKWEIEQASAMNQLLARADVAFRKRLYISPDEDNAFKWYQQILKKDPQNQLAHSRIKEIAEYLVLEAKNQLKAGNINSAQQSLKSVVTVSPDHRDIRKIQKNIDVKKRDVDLKNNIVSIRHLIPPGINQKQDDASVVEDMLGDFMQSFRKQDVAGLEKIVRLDGQKKTFLSNVFSAYSEINIKAESFRVIKSVGKAEVALQIYGLINKAGKSVETNAAWNRMNLIFNKKHGYWLKAEMSQ